MTARQRILEATCALLVEGEEELSMERVAQAAGVSRQTLYVNFGSRTALFIETAKFLDAHSGLAERVTAYRTAPDARSALREYVDFWCGYVPVIYPLARVLIAARGKDAAANEAWEDRMRDVRSGCLRVTLRLEDEELLADGLSAPVAADLLFGTLSVQSWDVYRRDCGWTQDEYVAAMHRAVELVLLGAPNRRG